MTTPLEFSGKMSQAAANVRAVDQEILTKTTAVLKQSALLSVRAVAPSGRLSGVGKRGAAVGVRYTLHPETKTARVFMTGPAHLIERDTKAHRIPRENRRRNKNRPIVIPGVGPRRSADHPGTKGQHPWEKGVAAGLKRTDDVAATVYFGTVRKVFK